MREFLTKTRNFLSVGEVFEHVGPTEAGELMNSDWQNHVKSAD